MNNEQQCYKAVTHESKLILSYQRKVYKDVSEICKPLFDEFDITFFSQTRAFHDGQFTSLMNTTDLTEYYLDRKYPIYLSQGKGITLNTGIYIAANLENPFQQKMHQELKKIFNVDHMIHLIEKQNDYDDMYTFATTPENYKMINQFINNLDIIKHFILYYKDKSASLIKKTNKVRYGSEYFSSPTASTSGTTIQNKHNHKNCLKNMVIKKIHIPTQTGEVSISQREFDCLKYAVKNLTLKEIAKFLNLSPRTVETYVNNLKYKLKCDTRTQLIDIVSQFNLF